MQHPDESTAARLCFVLESFHPIVHGAAIQIELVGQRLVKAGSSVLVVSRKVDPRHSSRENYLGIDVVRVKPAIGLSRFGKYLMVPGTLWTLFRRRAQYDTLIICDFKVLGVFGLLASRFLGKACYLRAESCGEMDGSFATRFAPRPSPMKARLIAMLISSRNAALKHAHGFLSICSAITNELRAAGVSPEAIIALTNGADTDHFSPASEHGKLALRKALCLHSEVQFVYTGRLARGKGLESLLRVWARLTGEIGNIHLTLIGAGQGFSLSCEDELRAFVSANGLDAVVTFTGNVSNVRDYLRAADVFVLPSLTEGLSISLIEAMSCGLACLTTKAGGTVDVIEDGVNGILIPADDDDRLYEAMKTLLRDRDRVRTLGTAARARVVEEFNIDQIAMEYVALSNRQS